MLEIAGRMAEFVHDTDPYGYKDQWDSADDAIDETLYTLEVEPEPQALINYLTEYIEEYKDDERCTEFVNDAYELIKDIQDCTKENG